MSSPLPIVEEGQSNMSLVVSSASLDSTCQSNPGLKERNYMGLSDCSSGESSVISGSPEEKNTIMNLKETELRLGLPGSQSPVRDTELCLLSSSKLDEKPLFPLVPLKDNVFSSAPKSVVSGNKRGFSDAMKVFSDVKAPAFTDANWMYPTTASESETAQSHGKFPGNQGVNAIFASRTMPNSAVKAASVKEQSGPTSAKFKDLVPPMASQDRSHGPNEGNHHQMNSANSNSNAPVAKAQVVGWPPIKSYRKHTLGTNAKNNDEVEGKPAPGALFVKVSMDGAPYLRKVDLKTYSTYVELSSSLEKKFSCFTIGQYASHGVPGRDMLSESKLRDLLHGSEYVLTYEDKDGDWMLVGDVPWEMFIESCVRLRIMKSSDAVGLAPRAMEKSRNKN